MNGSNNRINNLRYKITAAIARFMAGRYGADQLNVAILLFGMVLCIISIFLRGTLANLILTLISYIFVGWAAFRCLSRNKYRRYEENHRFLQLMERLKDREHRYFNCPRCHQPVRVPRKKGKIAITCPRCRERFIRKT